MSNAHPLIMAWREFSPRDGLNVLKGDECLLKPYGRAKQALVHKCSTFDEYTADPDFANLDNNRLHLGLTPVPFTGNLAEACVFILMLNPGFNELDYYAEDRSEDFRNALTKSLRQEITPDDFPMIGLDPRFAWHGGYDYWTGKLKDHLHDLCERGHSWTESLRLLSRKVAVVEFFPYHSRKFNLPQPIQDELVSGKLACQYVHEVLLPKAHTGKATVIVTRKSKAWGLRDDERNNIIVYTAQESHAAHLTRNSRGGRKISEFLGLNKI